MICVTEVAHAQPKSSYCTVHMFPTKSRFLAWRMTCGSRDCGQVVAAGTPYEVMNVATLKDVFGIRAHIARDPIVDTPMCVAYLNEEADSQATTGNV